MDENWILPADKLAARMGLPRVLSACPASMGEGEEGYSGAALFRLRAGFAGGRGRELCLQKDQPEGAGSDRAALPPGPGVYAGGP